ncbi:MAG: DMT family transporter [Anaerolineales bacterium]|nr:DMT family transporter [Anaerolineales bacterium]
MQTVLIFMVVGIVSGAVIGMQGPMSTIIAQRMGVLESVLIVHLGGVVVALVPLLLFQRGGKLGDWRTLPWYVYLAGVLGLVIFAAVTYLIPQIGATTTMMLIIVGQFLIGVVMDHFGWFEMAVRPFSLTKLVGLVVMLIGAWITIR